MLKTEKFSERQYLYCEELRKLGIKNGFTFSKGGVSRGKVEGLNLGFRVGDDESAVLENYRLVSSDLKLDFNSIVASRQTHSANIKIVESSDRGKGVTKESDIFETDGLVTGESNLPLVVFSADCYPVLLADKDKKAVAAVHSGWRGTKQEISKNAVEVMKHDFGVNPENIIAAIGPGIGKCCFEVSNDVAQEFENEYIVKKENGKFLIDLPAVVKKTLLSAGLKDENIHFSNRCTVCENHIFYSYRVHKEKTGRMGAFISL